MQKTLQRKEMFTGFRVLELASVLAGPSVGQFFAELGAEVIKVENPHTGGDVTRSWKSAGETTDDRSAYFCSCNWGKKSVALDLTKKTDLEIVKKLSMTSDVIIASYKPGDAEKLGVSYEQLKLLHPKLIYAQISGYGQRDERVGYDAVIQAESGFMELNGEKEGAPTKMPVALIDVLAAHHLKEGILLALLKRERTGEGDLVEVSLLQAAIASLVNQATNWLVGKKLPSRQGSIHPNIAPYGESFITRDGKRVLLAVGSDKQFDMLCAVLEIKPEDVAHFGSNKERVSNRAELAKILSEKISVKTAQEFLIQCYEKKIPAGLIQNMKEVFESPQAKEIMMTSLDRGGARSFVSLPSSFERNQLSPPPHLGEHTEEIIRLLNS
jgi:crotonobetainyl-CoA:carnitine CoA-transferase CaiB-like acyl-CoA transferase